MSQLQTMRSTNIPYSGRPFYARGVVGGHDVLAEVVGTELIMHPLVHERAEELVALGEEFFDSDGGLRYTASLLGHDIGTVLTVIRSFDIVIEFRMELPVRQLSRRTTGLRADCDGESLGRRRRRTGPT